MRLGKTIVFGFVGVLCALGTLDVATATQIEYRSPRQLGVEAATVVLGRVASVESRWNPQRTKIITETVITVDQTYKGVPQPVVRVTQLGGVVDNVRMEVAGSLQWMPGEEVLVFLEQVPSGALTVAGFTQGKFAVERNAVTGQPTIRQASGAGTEVLGAPAAPGATPDTAAPRIENIPLNRFVDQALGRR